MTSPRIAIAGAGIGGLTCARVLQLHGFENVTVFERESSPEARQQGGTIDLHADSGQEAVRAAGLFEQWRALARFEGQEQRKVDHATAALIEHEPAEGDFRPEIDRGQLRRLLLDSLTPGTVAWGRGIDSAKPGEVTFLNGSTSTFDLVVGADGAWSRVRQALSPAMPLYTGVMFVETRHDNDERLLDLTGQGTMVADGEGLMIWSQRNSGDHIRAYACMRAREDWKPSNADLMELYAGWHPSLLAFLEGELFYRPLYSLPVPHTWEHTPGVTLLGDAAHLQPPLGVGANLAMQDAAELALAIAADGVRDGVRAYESVMVPRSVSFAERTNPALLEMVPERPVRI
ncbi:FAD-dependent oxidoreductase [Lentzea flaviverrucosa]|uniref:2-polyprenyl-6-methoxyphenol hydroxylase n=1 Tax=Lentzea flaviverrucosa TaxID=200379 RepID=A0A1H9PYJ5_9PSEU|nr:FAD-dependent monooxygenase [Lentzea flaviverrucosa]RDI29683.1 2-polyprenyl-6-methoxyphenol hydroxylase-like FAD-dependent oxidoreductase [Lentzea flaviverrucosa]SER53301.1 2-polyprenyl-6-methoxyphenol hydroxylase [Lentzea flaviverrucosa]